MWDAGKGVLRLQEMIFSVLTDAWVVYLETWAAVRWPDMARLPKDAVFGKKRKARSGTESHGVARSANEEDPRLAPHLALMCSAFCYHGDAHQEFVLQGPSRIRAKHVWDNSRPLGGFGSLKITCRNRAKGFFCCDIL